MCRQYTTSVSATPGHIASRGAISMYCRPSRLSIVPQLGTSGGSPNPKKAQAGLRDDSPADRDRVDDDDRRRDVRSSVRHDGLPMACADADDHHEVMS